MYLLINKAAYTLNNPLYLRNRKIEISSTRMQVFTETPRTFKIFTKSKYK